MLGFHLLLDLIVLFSWIGLISMISLWLDFSVCLFDFELLWVYCDCFVVLDLL